MSARQHLPSSVARRLPKRLAPRARQRESLEMHGREMLLYRFALLGRTEDKGKSMLVVLLIGNPSRDPQRGGTAWQCEHQVDPHTYAQVLRYLDGDTVRANVRTARVENPRLGFVDLQQQVKIGRKTGHPIPEILNSVLPFFAHLDRTRMLRSILGCMLPTSPSAREFQVSTSTSGCPGKAGLSNPALISAAGVRPTASQKALRQF